MVERQPLETNGTMNSFEEAPVKTHSPLLWIVALCLCAASYGSELLAQLPPAATFRSTEYHIDNGAPDGDFDGTTYTLTLDQNLAEDYFIFVRGTRVGDSGGTNNLNPDTTHVRVVSVPGGKGDLPASVGLDKIGLSRHVADFNWRGVVTVVESMDGASDSTGFGSLTLKQLQ